jgi:hypothetical protein
MAITAMQIMAPTTREERGGDCATSRCTGLMEPPINIFTAHYILYFGTFCQAVVAYLTLRLMLSVRLSCSREAGAWWIVYK